VAAEEVRILEGFRKGEECLPVLHGCSCIDGSQESTWRAAHCLKFLGTIRGPVARKNLEPEAWSNKVISDHPSQRQWRENKGFVFGELIGEMG
jgi:hypothetical protein